MAIMSLLRLTDLNLIYKLMEVMESTTLGFLRANNRVIDGYPNDLDLNTITLWPTITVEIDSIFGRDIELGSNQWPAFSVTIDVLAKTDSQRDDISYYIWKELNEVGHTLYNFNSAFPSTSGAVDYSGIPTLGEWYIDGLTMINIEANKDSELVGLKHHSLLDGIIYLPNI